MVTNFIFHGTIFFNPQNVGIVSVFLLISLFKILCKIAIDVKDEIPKQNENRRLSFREKYSVPFCWFLPLS